MIQIIEMTHSGKVAMYNKIKKDKLIEMLIEANNNIGKTSPTINCDKSGHIFAKRSDEGHICTKCGAETPF